MNEENTKKLVETFPKLYRGRSLGIRESLMCFGFECEDGWYNIIYNLSKKIEEIISQPGHDNCYAVQVKQKLGTLRFYMTISTDEIEDLIEKATEFTEHTCEICGEEGKMGETNHHWISCRCTKCAEPDWTSYKHDKSTIP